MKIRRLLAILLIIVTFSNITVYAAENETTDIVSEAASGDVSSESPAIETFVISTNEVSTNEDLTNEDSTNEDSANEDSNNAGETFVDAPAEKTVTCESEDQAADSEEQPTQETIISENDDVSETVSETDVCDVAEEDDGNVATAENISDENISAENISDENISAENISAENTGNEEISIIDSSATAESIDDESPSEQITEILDGAQITIVSTENNSVTLEAGTEDLIGDGINTDKRTDEQGGSNYSVDTSTIRFEKVENHEYQADESISCSLRFQFTNTDTDELQECFITGIQIESSNLDAVCNAINNRVSGNEYYEDILQYAKDIASRFVVGKYCEITNKDSSGNTEWFDLIDAEKYSNVTGNAALNNGQEEEGQNYGDSRLCWAAASSNVITYTGWAKSEDAGNEDAVFTDFQKAFFDNAGNTAYGVQWYTGGINTMQPTDDNGNAILNSKLTDSSSFTQERGVDGQFTGAIKQTDYAATNISTLYALDLSSGVAGINKLAEYLDNGNGLGMTFSQFDYEQNLGGHCVSIFGYIKNIVKSGIDVIKSLFIADSDSNYVKTNGDSGITYEAVKDPEGTQDSRKAVINKYNMYYLSDCTTAANEKSVQMWYVSKPDDRYKYVIADIDLIRSCNNVKADFKTETEGTKNAFTTGDVVPYAIKIQKTAQVQDDVQVYLDLSNFSYRSITSQDGNPTVRYSIDMYDANNQLIRTEDRESTAETDSIKALSLVQVNTSIKFYATGDYYVGATVKEVGYYDSNNKWHAIQEAFTSNNGIVKERIEHIRINNRPYVNTVSGTNSVSVITNYYNVKSGAPVIFTINYPEVRDVKDLKILNNEGIKITDDDYTITKSENGDIVVTFKPEFLKTLTSKNHSFYLRWNNVYIRRFDINVM